MGRLRTRAGGEGSPSRGSPASLCLSPILATSTALEAADEPVTIRFGFANVGVDNRPFSGGSPIATAQAEHYVENELKDLPNVKVEYSFFKGAGPAVNEAFRQRPARLRLPGRSAAGHRPGQRPEDPHPGGGRRAWSDVSRRARRFRYPYHQGSEGPQGGDLPWHQQPPGGGQGAGGERTDRAGPAGHQHG